MPTRSSLATHSPVVLATLISGLLLITSAASLRADFVAEFELRANFFSIFETEMNVTLWRSGDRTRTDGIGRFWGMASPDTNLIERIHLSDAGSGIQWHVDRVEKTFVEITDADLFREDSLYLSQDSVSDLQAKIDSMRLMKPHMFLVSRDTTRSPETVNGFPARPYVFIVRFNPERSADITYLGETRFELEFWMTRELPVAGEIAELQAEWDAFAEKHRRLGEDLWKGSELLEIGEWLQGEIRSQRGYPVRTRILAITVNEAFEDRELDQLPEGTEVEDNTVRFVLAQIDLVEIKEESIPGLVFELPEGLTQQPYKSLWD